MKRFFFYAVLIVCMGCIATLFMSQIKFPAAQKAQALGNVVTVAYTQLPTNTFEPTYTPFPTVDYRATDQAYQLAMEQERNRMIEVQLQHDENMLAQQVELARVNGTATAAGTQIAQVSTQNAIAVWNLTLESSHITSTAEAPAQAAKLLQVATNAKNEKRDNIIYVSIAIAVIIFLVGVPSGVWRYVKLQEKRATTEYQPETPTVPEGLTPYIHEDKSGGDFERWYVPCTPDQMTEIWELIVNGERNFGINRIETTSRTLRRPTLVKLRKWLRENKFATELGAGEIALNDRFVAFVEKWGEDHELEEGYQFCPPPQDETI